MAAPVQHANNSNALPPDTLITIKVSVNENLKKLKLPLRDLTANVLPDKLRHLLGIKPEQSVVFERFSDSAGGYITLDPNNPQVFKTLIRAAKAKLKLRLKATVSPLPEEAVEEVVAEQKMPQKAMEPVIVRSPAFQTPPRDSTAFDRRSVGSGIFEFKEARASQQTLVDTSEAPLPRPFSTDSEKSVVRELAFRSREPAIVTNNGHPWSVYCNECDLAMMNAHFHCSICDGGDYDLCENCVTNGKLCPGEGHWLIKRYIQGGKVINSTTERISPRGIKPTPVQPVEVDVEKEIPGAFTDDSKTLAEEPRTPSRTCNSCVVVLPEHEFVTCNTCEDFDLCIPCHMKNKHGHHPGHAFKPATEETIIPLVAETLLAAGRNVVHNAICDGCNKKIRGVRHKCLGCPDWDYCNDCAKNSRRTHPYHRFAAIYEPIGDAQTPYVRHNGIYCDGPLCTNQNNPSYITGVRYKCAVCHDTDYCASCESHPSNSHNRTHPMIKFKTPVRNATITTENEELDGEKQILGDRIAKPAQPETKSAATETTPVQQANAATQVQTVAEIMPTESKETVAEPKALPSTTNLHAHFVRDIVSDGMTVLPGARFTQVWTMRNPGPHAWPAGCSVRFVGGDNMLNVDNTRPAAVSDINEASESNIVGRDIQPREEVAFKVTLKAPMREGKCISYWRMKAADGTPFGHRLWCDITVKKPAEAPATEVPIIPGAPQAGNATPNLAQMQQKLRQHQMTMLKQQQTHAQQVQQLQHLRQQSNSFNYAPPPAYEANSAANISARIASMREQQAKRREAMIAQLNANREQLQAMGIKREDMPGWGQHFNPNLGSPREQTEEDKARKEAENRARVENLKAVKARIMRARDARDKMETNLETSPVEKEVPAAKPVEEEKAEDSEGSQMVFPKLEKESPASSIHQSATSSGKAAYVENEEGEIERTASPAIPISEAPASEIASPASEIAFPAVEDDIDDDIEIVSAFDEGSDDEGFLTDEEYDILDASDQETVTSK